MKLEMEVGINIKINGNNGGGVGLWLQHRNGVGGSAACHVLCTPVKIMGKGADIYRSMHSWKNSL